MNQALCISARTAEISKLLNQLEENYSTLKGIEEARQIGLHVPSHLLLEHSVSLTHLIQDKFADFCCLQSEVNGPK
jgi:hypothetical protein